MGEEPGTAGASVTTTGNKTPEQIREEIEATRQDLGHTVEALAAKADVKARMRERIVQTKQSATQKLGKAREASPDGVTSGAAQATEKARQNPVPVAAAGAFLGGFLLGRLTRRD
jgi:hypothetical protein